MVRAEKVFLVIAVAVGLLLVFLVPPLNAADEQTHFLNAYSLSRGKPWGEISENGVYSRCVPEEYARFVSKYPGRIRANTLEKYSYSEMIGESRTGSSLDKRAYTGSVISPTGYIPSAAGMVIGTAISSLFREYAVIGQPYNQMIFGRLGNLFFYIVVVYCALKIIPCLKRTLLLAATMPMCLFQAASLSYDAVLIPVSFLFTAIVLKLIRQRDTVIRNGEIAAVLFCVFFMTGVKGAFTAPLLLMLLAVPREKYGTTRKMILCIGMVLGAGILGYLPQIIDRHIAAGAAVKADAVFEACKAQREWAGQNILKLPGIFLKTLWSMKAVYMDSFFGMLGWLDTPFPVPMTIFGLFMIVVSAVIETCSCRIFSGKEWWKRLLPFFGAVISVAGLMLAMYLDHTPRPEVTNTIGGDFVEGVQGRYFIPLFLPMIVAFSNGLIPHLLKKKNQDTVREKFRRILNASIYGWSALCGVFTLMIVVLRYWI